MLSLQTLDFHFSRLVIGPRADKVTSLNPHFHRECFFENICLVSCEINLTFCRHSLRRAIYSLSPRYTSSAEPLSSDALISFVLKKGNHY